MCVIRAGEGQTKLHVYLGIITLTTLSALSTVIPYKQRDECVTLRVASVAFDSIWLQADAILSPFTDQSSGISPLPLSLFLSLSLLLLSRNGLGHFAFLSLCAMVFVCNCNDLKPVFFLSNHKVVLQISRFVCSNCSTAMIRPQATFYRGVDVDVNVDIGICVDCVIDCWQEGCWLFVSCLAMSKQISTMGKY